MSSTDPVTTADPVPSSGGDDRESILSSGSGVPELTGSRYSVTGFHARGGLGEVYTAFDRELHRPLALKTVQLVRDDALGRARFVREAEITARLDHPGIVPVHGLVTTDDGRPAYAMRFIVGTTLQEAIEAFHRARPRDFRSLAFRQLLTRFVSVCQTMAFAHGRGVIHRDLKPSNIMLGHYGETLVVDWGLAIDIGPAGHPPDAARPSVQPPAPTANSSACSDSPSAARLTICGQAVGTPQYMSPEQAAGELDGISPASDIYCLGTTLYCLLTGRPPMPVSDWKQIKSMIEAGEYPRPCQIVPALPAGLEAICLKAMARSPDGRYAGAAALAEDIERWMADEPISAHRDPWHVRWGRWVRRRRTAATGIATAGLVGLIASAVGIGQATSARQREDLLTQVAVAREAEARQKKRLARDVFDAILSEPTLLLLESSRGLTPVQVEFLSGALKHYEQFADDQPDDAADRLAMAKAGVRAGFVLERLGRTAEASTVYERAVAILDLPEPPPEFRRPRADARIRWAKLLIDLNRPTDAAGQLGAAFRELRPMIDHDPDSRLILARGLNNRGYLALAAGQWSAAEADFLEASDLLGVLHEAHARRLDASVRFNLAVALMRQNRGSEAEAAFRRAIESAEQLRIAHPDDLENRALLARGLAGLSALLRSLDRAAESGELIRAACGEWCRLIAVAPSSAEFRHEFARCANNLGNWLSANGFPAEAEPEYRRALAAYDRLIDDAPTVLQHAYERSMLRSKLGHLLMELGRPAEAEAELRSAADSLRRIHEQAPQNREYSIGLSGACINMGLFLRDTGRPAESLPFFDEAVVGISDVARHMPHNPTVRAFLCKAHRGRAVTLSRLERPADALSDWDVAADYSGAAWKAEIELGRAACWAWLGRIDDALAVAESYAETEPLAAARVYGRAAIHDAKYVPRALELLKRTTPADPRWAVDSDFAALVGHPEFRALLSLP